MQNKGTLNKSTDLEKLRSDIKDKILSMSEIARQMNVSKAQLSRFLSGDIDNDAMILRCANWLGKTTNDYTNIKEV